MNSLDLNRLALPINIACAVAGILAYSVVAPGAPARQTALFALAAFAVSFVGSRYMTRQLRRQSALSQKDQDEGPLATKILLVLPLVLCSIEVCALLYMHAAPSAMSWLHIVAACAAGQNAEGAFARK